MHCLMHEIQLREAGLAKIVLVWLLFSFYSGVASAKLTRLKGSLKLPHCDKTIFWCSPEHRTSTENKQVRNTNKGCTDNNRRHTIIQSGMISNILVIDLHVQTLLFGAVSTRGDATLPCREMPVYSPLWLLVRILRTCLAGHW